MKFAMFQTPFMRPTRSPREVFDWAVQQAITCDQAGFSEYWIGEHATMTYESIPNPELVISACARETDQLVMAPGAHLLPYHNAASLAVQVAWMTHLLKGRYILGVGAGAYPTDGAVRGFKDLSKNHKMVFESLEIMQRVWKNEPFHFEGEYFTAGVPEGDPSHPLRDLRPYGGTVDIAMAGLSPNSPSLTFAGKNGWIPLSVYAGEAAIAGHWDTYSAAAAENGHAVDRSVLRVVRDIIVADTDAEARDLAVNGGVGDAWGNYLMPVYKQFGLLEAMLPGVDMNDVDIDTLVEKVWIVGSPDTVAEKLQGVLERTGGWGTTLVYSHDYSDAPEAWNHSLELLTKEVAPKLAAL
ncbi:LLM class flavin-dependent oxidoreductase [Sporichthya sp.]|uniref:LLM class flavin-dependent oxidoreductase n=1 Tax=Sporichthya sp. TaxID=65475 RepID=UPI0018454106|nr:LLM class flavin-dependent oxidoreductase [Sporichthya sp.]MBA3743574.1 LLM class flavin-dependent oxidoreductase [Sporichthya sp.]